MYVDVLFVLGLAPPGGPGEGPDGEGLGPVPGGPGEGPDCHVDKEIADFGPISARIRGALYFEFAHWLGRMNSGRR